MNHQPDLRDAHRVSPCGRGYDERGYSEELPDTLVSYIFYTNPIPILS
ncbi:hypothetical protein BN903_22 [Halorubrum sp. AJ67]|nr:hypothetical protein BN903_22 [Halorubrum sp. AJ67]